MNIKQLLLIALIFCHLPAYGLWYKAIQAATTIAAKHTRKVIVAAAGGAAGTIIANQDISDERRMAILNHPLLRDVKTQSPAVVDTYVITPLINKLIKPLIDRIKYKNLDEFINESEEKTNHRKNIAQFLIARDIPLSLCQTEADILSNILKYSPKRKKQHLKESPSAINALFIAEKQANEKKLTVLYHAMPKDFYAANYIGTQLESITQNIIINPDFLTLRQPIIKDQHFENNDPHIREKLLKRKGFDTFESLNFWDMLKGLISIDWVDFDRQHDHYQNMNKYVASCNYAISGNSSWNGESSLTYWQSNLSINFPQKSIDSTVLFDAYAIPTHLRAKYAHRLKSAVKQFNTSKTGVLLQIIMPEWLLDETVYPASPWGLKRNLYKCQGEMCESLNTPSKLFTELSNQRLGCGCYAA